MGLSEVTAVDGDTLAVVERDKLNGPSARVKRVYTVDVSSGAQGLTGLDGDLPVLGKKLAIDVLPALKAPNGWVQEKLEGFTIAADGSLYGVTDNDGLKDATGETVFLRLGRATDAFADALATTTTIDVARGWAFGTRTTAQVTVSGASASGEVEVLDGAKVVATGALQSGSATLDLSGLEPGRRTLTARFAGSALAGASTSAPVTVEVARVIHHPGVGVVNVGASRPDRRARDARRLVGCGADRSRAGATRRQGRRHRRAREGPRVGAAQGHREGHASLRGALPRQRARRSEPLVVADGARAVVRRRPCQARRSTRASPSARPDT